MAEKKYLDRDGLSTVLTKIGERFSKTGHTHTKNQITDFNHNHDDRYYTESEINTKTEAINAALDGKAASNHTHNGLIQTITTAGTGSAYTATVPGLTLTVGASFIMIPHVTSTSTTPTLNVNGLGAKTLRRRVSNSSVTTVASVSANWLYLNKPVNVMYDGTYWIVDMDRPNTKDLYGTIETSQITDKAITSAKLADGVIPTVPTYLPNPNPLAVFDYGSAYQRGGFSYDGSSRIDVELLGQNGIDITCGLEGSGSLGSNSYKISASGKQATDVSLGMVKAIPWSSFASSGDNKDQGVYIDEDGTLRCALASDTNDGILGRVDYQYFEHKAGIDSPTFIGTPRSNALLNGTENDSQLATTQFVHDAIYHDTVTRAIQAHGSSAAQALSSTAITKIPLTTADFTYDTTSFSITGGGIKCLKDGYVEVCGSMYLSNSATSASYGCYIKLDSTEVLSSTHVALDAHSGSTSTATKLIKVTAGQTFTLNARGASGGTVYPANVATFLYVKYVNYATSGVA